jgi:TolB-like protein/DNA-binding winged helix-turn-helix (wHTH) protein/Tfp pilus assembly protein PilF
MLFRPFCDEDVMNEHIQTYEFDDVRIDLLGFEVTKAGERLKIEPKAYEVLLHLVENRARVVEKSELLDIVWKDSFVTDNALTRVVAQLRKALGDSHKSRYIATVHKRGYRFVGELARPSATEPARLEPAAIRQPLPREPRRHPSARRSLVARNRSVAGAALAVGVVVVGAAYRARPSRIPSVGSVAVLPLHNVGANPDSDDLSDGLTHGLVDSLARLPQLTVSSRSTVFRYKGRSVDPAEVGAELGVDAVLLGKLLAHGDDVVVSVELVDARGGARLWSGRYDAKQSELPAVEQRIAHDVTDAVHLRLSERDRCALARGRTDNPVAYDAYLRGRYYWNTRSVLELRQSVESFGQAIAADPEYAPAHAGLADAYSLLGASGFVRPDEAFPEAKAAANRAIALDALSAEAYTALAAARINYDWDWEQAARELELAVELDPQYPNAHVVRSQYQLWVGRLDEAVGEARRACELDPLGCATTMNLGWTFYYARRYEAARSEFLKVLDLSPEFAPALYGLGETFERTGLLDEAVATLARAKAAGGGYPSTSLAHALGVSGRRTAAARETAALVELAGRQYVSPYYVAVAHLGLGETDAAIRWIQQAYEERSGTLLSVRANPRFDRLRDVPAFARLLERIGPNRRFDGVVA